jgi:hypothetical protein
MANPSPLDALEARTPEERAALAFRLGDEWPADVRSRDNLDRRGRRKHGVVPGRQEEDRRAPRTGVMLLELVVAALESLGTPFAVMGVQAAAMRGHHRLALLGYGIVVDCSPMCDLASYHMNRP